MWSDLLRVLVVIGSGTVAGVFVAVTLSVMPTLAVLPVNTYVRVHQLLGKGYHPTMPAIVLLVLAGDITLAVTDHADGATQLLVLACVFQVGVQVVSHLRNEQLNKRVRLVDGTVIPASWTDPRESWRRWHLVRTTLAIAVFVINATIAVLPT
jgi:uncharacterized membrane protein